MNLANYNSINCLEIWAVLTESFVLWNWDPAGWVKTIIRKTFKGRLWSRGVKTTIKICDGTRVENCHKNIIWLFANLIATSKKIKIDHRGQWYKNFVNDANKSDACEKDCTLDMA